MENVIRLLKPTGVLRKREVAGAHMEQTSP
jgi:hypothetical protein